jgi:hypothetical protein
MVCAAARRTRIFAYPAAQVFRRARGIAATIVAGKGAGDMHPC